MALSLPPYAVLPGLQKQLAKFMFCFCHNIFSLEITFAERLKRLLVVRVQEVVSLRGESGESRVRRLTVDNDDSIGRLERVERTEVLFPDIL